MFVRAEVPGPLAEATGLGRWQRLRAWAAGRGYGPGPLAEATARVTGTTPKQIPPRFVLAIPILILDAWAARTAFRSARRSVPHGRYQKYFQACAVPDTRKYFPVRRPISKNIFKPVQRPIRKNIFKPVRRPIRKNISVPFRFGDAASRGGPGCVGASPGVN